MADSIRTTSGIVAIIFMISIGLVFILNDSFGLGIYLLDNKKNVKPNNNSSNHQKNQNERVKPIYVPKGGTKYAK